MLPHSTLKGSEAAVTTGSEYTIDITHETSILEILPFKEDVSMPLLRLS